MANLARWLRWAAFAPIAAAVYNGIYSLYFPVGAFLGGYFPAWTYKLALVLFAFVATFIGVTLAIAIVPSRPKVVGIIAATVFVAIDYCTMRPFWPMWYAGAYLLSNIIAATLAYFIATGVLDLFATSQEASTL